MIKRIKNTTLLKLMAMLFVAGAGLTFTACGGDDDEPDGGGGNTSTSSDYLVSSITLNSSRTLTFTYDSENKLKKVEDTNYTSGGQTRTTLLTWSGDFLTVEETIGSSKTYNPKVQLNSDGTIASITGYYDKYLDLADYTFTYNSKKQLTSMVITVSSSEYITYTYTWSSNNIVSIDYLSVEGGYRVTAAETLKYNDPTKNCGLPYISCWFDDMIPPAFFYAGLLGVAPSQLPDAATQTIKASSGESDTRNWTCVYGIDSNDNITSIDFYRDGKVYKERAIKYQKK